MAYYRQCPICGCNLDPEEKCDCREERHEDNCHVDSKKEGEKFENTLQRQTEHYLGTTIVSFEWNEAKAYAEHKLRRIIEHEGDGNGIRRESWYLAQLIAETIRGNRFAQSTLAFKNQMEYDDENLGVKKDSPYSKTRAIRHHPYCSTGI